MDYFLSILLPYFEQFPASNPFEAMWFLFIYGGWIPLLFVLLKGASLLWLFNIRIRWEHHQRFIFLCVDVPKGNEQTPKAVENIFSHFAGAHGSINKYEKWWKGITQLSISLELVSLGGHIKFIIHTPAKFRDLIEASIYSQYPDAQISEIEDYTASVPRYYPNATHQMWACEFIFSQPTIALPIRTYPEFEDKVSGEFKDPLSVILEDFARLSEGEQAWFQIVLTPIAQKEWPKHGEHLINKIICRKEPPPKPSFLERLLEAPLKLIGALIDLIIPPGEHAAKEEGGEESKILYLPPHEKAIIEAIGKKISKIGFEAKIRFIYVARRELYSPSRVVNGFVGGIKQFNTVDMNSFKPATKHWTAVAYDWHGLRANWRRNKHMRAYRGRSDARGAGKECILNIEELATLWHFPVMQVKAPLVKKAEMKKAEPPFTLPVVE
jgi:hypothetical protein